MGIIDKKKELSIGRYIVELIIPDKFGDLSYLSTNNINTYDENGTLLWNISELLKEYSNINGFKYYEEMYFDIRILDNQNIFCIGYINHCEVDLEAKKIVNIVNNR